MTATGFAFFIPLLVGQVDGRVASTAWILLVDSWIFFFVALLLSLLTGGRLQSTFDRALVASYAIPLVVLQVTWLLFARAGRHEPAGGLPRRRRRGRRSTASSARSWPPAAP